MDYLPLFLNIRGRSCMLVGGGEVALRKASLLIRAGARIQLIAPQVSKPLADLVSANQGSIEISEFKHRDLSSTVLIIAATDDTEVNERVFECATAQGIPVNVVDQPSLCSFILPAVVDRDPVIIAISSGGSSPILVRKFKEVIESHIPQGAGRLASILKSFRARAKSQIDSFSQRMRFWEDVVDSEVSELVYSGQEQQAKALIESKMCATENSPAQGEVYLVGAGPGDPDLLTLRALRLLQKADVVLYDRLVSKEILARVRPDAEKIHVGKARSQHTVPQENINEMLVRLAQAGKRVLRLKGGDPFIFGRGGEELETLAQHQVRFQVVPGITAASGCASYAGIPLTHRDHSQSVRFLTGHFTNENSHLDWSLLVKEKQTLVFYMGLVGLATICEELVRHGMAKSTPIAIIQQGTTAHQKVLTANLSNMAELAQRQHIRAPTIIIIGDVVTLRNKLNWFQGEEVSATV